MPEDAAKFAVVIDRLVDTKSRRKRKALADRNILPSTTRKELEYSAALEKEVGKEYQQLRNSKKKHHVSKRATLSSVLLSTSSASAGQRSLRRIRKKYGISFKFMKKCHSQNFDRKRPTNALSVETAQKVKEFNRGDVSRTDPSPASVSLKTQEPKRVMEMTLKVVN